MQTGEWLKPGALNTIHYSIKLADGTKKEGLLRFTKSQQERFLEFTKKDDSSKKHLDITVIALNPNHEAPDFTDEQIEAAFDVDQIVILNRLWLRKKVENPELTPGLDPKFFA